jgi:hypothetical protein
LGRVGAPPKPPELPPNGLELVGAPPNAEAAGAELPAPKEKPDDAGAAEELAEKAEPPNAEAVGAAAAGAAPKADEELAENGLLENEDDGVREGGLAGAPALNGPPKPPLEAGAGADDALVPKPEEKADEAGAPAVPKGDGEDLGGSNEKEGEAAVAAGAGAAELAENSGAEELAEKPPKADPEEEETGALAAG